jgi:hypothetical protein
LTCPTPKDNFVTESSYQTSEVDTDADLRV